MRMPLYGSTHVICMFIYDVYLVCFISFFFLIHLHYIFWSCFFLFVILEQLTDNFSSRYWNS